MSSDPETDVQFYIFAGNDVHCKDLIPFKSIPNVNIVRNEIFDKKQKGKRLFNAVTTGCDRLAAKLFISKKIDVVFEVATFYGWRFPLPIIGWIPDFQHRHLPKLFGPVGYLKRELGFRAQLLNRSIMMVSSQDSFFDCKNFYSKIKGQIKVVPFAVKINRNRKTLDPDKVRKTYNLPNGYFFLPNQFWRHKNHKVVISALRILRHKKIVIAASGNTKDLRCKGYYAELKKMVLKFNMEKRFLFLGLVPYSQLIALMRACRAIINPSLFEGWSTTVEEARALGIRMLLSDIPVHHEQMGTEAVYFPPHDPVALSRLLENENSKPLPAREEREIIALKKMPLREKTYAQAFNNIVEIAVKS